MQIYFHIYKQCTITCHISHNALLVVCYLETGAIKNQFNLIAFSAMFFHTKDF